ncbi:MAG: polyprenyl diphosphate synthase, partial [Firmicutes bacterium]|nr:polyprenyl diphosphate synthase [Bacillota bacterium]
KLKRSLLDTKNSNLKIKIIGKKSDLPNNVFELSKKLEEISKNNAGMRLNIAINYGSRQEIIMVTKKIAQKVLENEIEIKDISENTFCKNLYTQDQPDVDLLIRTGGEFRISNFLLWQISYAEIFFTKTFWPDFSPNDFDEAIEEYKKRNRRFGGNMVSSF